MFAWQFAKAQHIAEQNGWTKFVSMQNHYNLIYREEEREMIPLCLDQGVGRHPVEPVGPGHPGREPDPEGERHTTRSTTDPFTDYLYEQPTDFDVVEQAQEVAAARGVPTAQVALAWLLSKPGVTAPIVGSTKLRPPARTRWRPRSSRLTADEVASLEKPYVPHPVLGHF